MTGDPAVGRSESVEEFDTSCAAASRLISNTKIWSNGTRSGEGRDITQKKGSVFEDKAAYYHQKGNYNIACIVALSGSSNYIYIVELHLPV